MRKLEIVKAVLHLAMQEKQVVMFGVVGCYCLKSVEALFRFTSMVTSAVRPRRVRPSARGLW